MNLDEMLRLQGMERCFQQAKLGTGWLGRKVLPCDQYDVLNEKPNF